jgi:hypothetical protein
LPGKSAAFEEIMKAIMNELEKTIILFNHYEIHISVQAELPARWMHNIFKPALAGRTAMHWRLHPG